MRYIAFLAGINVGKRRVKMDQLRSHFELAGWQNVESLIASGNVVFDAERTPSRKLEQEIEAVLENGLGYRVSTFIRTPNDIAKVLARNPFRDRKDVDPQHTINVSFLGKSFPIRTNHQLETLTTPRDELKVFGRELYWLCRGKTTDSLIAWSELAKIIHVASTMRNLNTVAKLNDKLTGARDLPNSR